MAHSSSNDSSVRGIPEFWQIQTIDPQIREQIGEICSRSAVRAKQNVNTDLWLNPVEKYQTNTPIKENAPEGTKINGQKKRLIGKNLSEQKNYNDEEAAAQKTELKF